MTADSQQQDTPVRVRILAGTPTEQELAAVVLALEEAAEQQADARPARDAAWLRAALLEGVGEAPVATAADARLKA